MRGKLRKDIKDIVLHFTTIGFCLNGLPFLCWEKKILDIIIVNTSKMNCKNMIGILNTVVFQPIHYISNMYLFVSTYDESFAHFLQMYLCYQYTICSKLMHFNRILSSNQGHVILKPVTVVYRLHLHQKFHVLSWVDFFCSGKSWYGKSVKVVLIDYRLINRWRY